MHVFEGKKFYDIATDGMNLTELELEAIEHEFGSLLFRLRHPCNILC